MSDADPVMCPLASPSPLPCEVAAARRMPHADADGDVAIEDWDTLLGAVKARLRRIGGEPAAGEDAPSGYGSVDRLHTSVLECVSALDQLHATFSHERARRQQLEREVCSAHGVLVQSLDRLIGDGGLPAEALPGANPLPLHDMLTGLPNEACFRQRLEHGLSSVGGHGQRVAVLLVEVDEFGALDAGHGRGTGDEVLRIAAARLTRGLGAADTVSRRGTNQFACLLGDRPTRERLGQMARQLLDAVSAPLKIGRLRLAVRVSLGIVVSPDDGRTGDDLLASAERAVSEARRSRTGYAFADQCRRG